MKPSGGFNSTARCCRSVERYNRDPWERRNLSSHLQSWDNTPGTPHSFQISFLCRFPNKDNAGNKPKSVPINTSITLGDFPAETATRPRGLWSHHPNESERCDKVTYMTLALHLLSSTIVTKNNNNLIPRFPPAETWDTTQIFPSHHGRNLII